MPIVYDIETFPNVFTVAAVGCETDDVHVWEISERRDDRAALLQWLHHLARERVEMVGFNNVHFDYPVLHQLLLDPSGSTAASLYAKAKAIITGGDRFAHTIWPGDRWIPQIDLFKIHHFDNVARSTGLKALQFAMRAESVEDLPFEPGTWLAPDQIDTLRQYNVHDVLETKRFYNHAREAIAFRRQIGERYGRDFMNHNDTKIGKDYFVMRLEEANPGSCYTGTPRRPVQTHRDRIVVADIILPCVQFRHPEFNRILAWFRAQVLHDTRGAISDLSCEVNGFTFRFGTGGIHGSLERHHVSADDEHAVIDLDVTSYYPSIAIVNRLHPAHLGNLFCEIYADVMAQRKSYAKGTPENAVLKLALNGVYGDSNNPHSPFYDPQYTMSITINGQLMLCMLAECLMLTVPGLELIQINTDGLTVRVPRTSEPHVKAAGDWWQIVTGMNLERTDYARMYVRDVNNYVAVSTSGKIKRKGAYENAPPGERNPLGWHQDTSALVVPKAAEATLVHGVPANVAVATNRDPFDFMLRAKAPRGSHLEFDGKRVQQTVRYYVAKRGADLIKVSPPPDGLPVGQFKRAPKVGLREYLGWHQTHGNVWNPEVHTKNQSVYDERRISIVKGWPVAICNHAGDFDWDNVAFDWYVQEAKKLID